MHIEIAFKNQKQNLSEQWHFVLQLLRSLDFVESVKVEEAITIAENPISELLLHGPTMTEQDEAFYNEKQQHFQAWN